MDIILITRRAKDGKVTEKQKTCNNYKDFASGCDIVLRTKLITGYCLKDAVTGEVLVSKGKV